MGIGIEDWNKTWCDELKGEVVRKDISLRLTAWRIIESSEEAKLVKETLK